MRGHAVWGAPLKSESLICKELIGSLHQGMEGLQKFAAQEKPVQNTVIVRVADPTTGQVRLEHKVLGTNFEAQSIKTNVSYKWSAIGEMDNEALDQLNEKNQKRQYQIEQRYEEANAGIMSAKEIMKAQHEHFETKEKFKDASINYPTYGRGLPNPGIELNTFMVQETMCEDKGKKKRQASNSASPKADVQAQQRKRILSPRRQRYESKFEKYYFKKNVDDRLYEDEHPILDFDTTTKPQGTMNAKVNNKM